MIGEQFNINGEKAFMEPEISVNLNETVNAGTCIFFIKTNNPKYD